MRLVPFLASHDDATENDVHEPAKGLISLAEFPTRFEAAKVAGFHDWRILFPRLKSDIVRFDF